MTQQGPAPHSQTASEQEAAQIASFVRGASFELTRPRLSDLDEIAERLPPATPIYLTAVPGRPTEELVAAARCTRERGLEPVPHLAARQFHSIAEIAGFLDALAREAAVTAIMLVGGDSPPRPGFVPDAITVLQSGAIEGAGVRAVGLPGFPDGHPFLSEEELELALVTKIAAAQKANLDAHVVTQFCFDFRPIETWIAWLRRRGIHAPVRVGFAGPTNLMSWLKFAHRCGVRASAEALASRSGLARHAFKSVGPDILVRAAAAMAADPRSGAIAPHFFAFGGAGVTARWAAPLAEGAVVLNSEGGFDPDFATLKRKTR